MFPLYRVSKMRKQLNKIMLEHIVNFPKGKTVRVIGREQ